MSQSKLSVLPYLKTYEPEFHNFNGKDVHTDPTYDEPADPTYVLSNYNWLWYEPVVGLPIRMLDRIDRDMDRNQQFDNRFKPQALIVKLNNKGELASANIKITLLFRTYGTAIEYGKNKVDEFDYTSLKRKLFSQKKVVIKVPYMGADDSKEFQIVDLKGQFRETELILCKIRANGHTYFKENWLSKILNKRVVTNHYYHPYLQGGSSTADTHALIGLGQGYTNTEWKDPYKRIGGIKWLRNWFAEWRK